jgi:hypothetical protein
MRTVTVAEFNSAADAEPLHQRLVAAGIKAVLCNGSRPETTPTFFRPSAGVRIEVPRDEFETAFRLVYDWNSEQRTEGTDIPLPNQSSGTGTKDSSDNPWLRR